MSKVISPGGQPASHGKEGCPADQTQCILGCTRRLAPLWTSHSHPDPSAACATRPWHHSCSSKHGGEKGNRLMLKTLWNCICSCALFTIYRTNSCIQSRCSHVLSCFLHSSRLSARSLHSCSSQRHYWSFCCPLCPFSKQINFHTLSFIRFCQMCLFSSYLTVTMFWYLLGFCSAYCQSHHNHRKKWMSLPGNHLILNFCMGFQSHHHETWYFACVMLTTNNGQNNKSTGQFNALQYNSIQYFCNNHHLCLIGGEFLSLFLKEDVRDRTGSGGRERGGGG